MRYRTSPASDPVVRYSAPNLKEGKTMAKRLTLRMLGKLDKKTGRHADGDGLYLKVMSLERRFWTYRYRLAGKETEVKIGDYPETTVDKARAIHVQKRALVTNQQDP